METGRRLLITGVTGLLGSYLAEECIKIHEVFGISQKSAPTTTAWEHEQLNLTNRNLVLRYLNKIRPQVIVHCAAMTNVDRCESEPLLAWSTNVAATETLALWTAECDAKLIVMSTDSVFDGESGAYCETDIPRPLNEYARTKLAAERSVRSHSSSALIIRTNFFGWSRNQQGLAEWMLKRLSARQSLRGFTDVQFGPLFAGDLAKVIIELIQHNAAGIFHAAARDSCSKYEFARLLAEEFDLPVACVEPILLREASLVADRPKNTFLSTAKIRAYLVKEIPTVKQGIRAMHEAVRGRWSAPPDMRKGRDSVLYSTM